MERYPHINPKFRHCLSLSDEERITFIRESRWIGYSQAREILQLLEEMLNYPKKPRMPNILLVGESNNGKTTLIHHFYKKHGETYEDEDLNLVKPILMIESPATASEKALYMAILNELMAVYRDTASVETLYTQTLHLMRTFGVKMLIIDEFHSMFSGTARKQRDMMNTLKRLCNELQIPIIGVGTENAVNILHTDKQFASRFEVCELPAWEFNEDFLRLMMSFESVLPLAMQPVIGLMQGFNHFPIQEDIDAYLRKKPGQRAALTGFISYLRREYALDLHINKVTKKDQQRMKVAKRNALEKKVIAYIMRCYKDPDAFRLHDWLRLALPYFHWREIRSEYTVIERPDGYMVSQSGEEMFVPKLTGEFSFMKKVMAEID